MRPIRITVATLALACACATPPAARATQQVSLTAAITPERLGAGTTLTLAFTIATTSGSVPSPLTGLELLYPNNFGIATSGLGLETCSAAILEHQGPTGCPPDSQIGSGTALVEIPIGPEILSETATTTIFMAPVHSGHTTLLFSAIGKTPLAAQIVFTGRLLPAQQPFGGELYTTIPLVPTLPEAPDAAVVQLRSAIGPLHLTYYRHTHGRLLPYHPKGILLPPTCPHHGWQFAAHLHFHDGTHTNAHTTVPCPPKERTDSRGVFASHRSAAHIREGLPHTRRRSVLPGQPPTVGLGRHDPPSRASDRGVLPQALPQGDFSMLARLPIQHETAQRGRFRVVRLGGIEPPTCGLKGRCSLAPRRLPLTTELQAHGSGERAL
jgi:hypothetical protein